MNDFFTLLAARATGALPLVSPRLAPRFAPFHASATRGDDVWWERMSELQAAELQVNETATETVDPTTHPQREPRR